MNKKFCSSCVAPWFPRIAFGVTLLGYGVNHYRHIGDLTAMSKSAYQSVPALGQLAGVLAYIFPALLILGGILFATKQLCWLSKILVLAALGGIIGWGGLAVLVGDSQMAGAMMPAIQNGCVFLITYYVIKKLGCCCHGGSCNCNGTHGKMDKMA